LAKHLVALNDELPQLAQCIVDVKAGLYQPSDAAIVASGGDLEPVTNETTGDPVVILVRDEDVITKETTLTTDSGDTLSVSADGETGASESEEPAAEVTNEPALEEPSETPSEPETSEGTSDQPAESSTEQKTANETPETPK
jgi:hypothetical protein